MGFVDSAQATNAPQEVEIAGETYRVRQLKFKEWGRLTAFLKDRHDSPMTRAARQIDAAEGRGEPLSQAAREALWERAERAEMSWPPRIGSQPWWDILQATPGGREKFIHVAISACRPKFTEAQAEELSAAENMPLKKFEEVALLALYGIRDLPKGEAPEDGAEEKRSNQVTDPTTGTTGTIG